MSEEFIREMTELEDLVGKLINGLLVYFPVDCFWCSSNKILRDCLNIRILRIIYKVRQFQIFYVLFRYTLRE